VAQLGARFHGMEEVIGSIPIRSTNHLEAPPFRDLVASLSQIPNHTKDRLRFGRVRAFYSRSGSPLGTQIQLLRQFVQDSLAIVAR
jgi:hypothetical protein